jgi:hypothetical protein
LPFRFNRPNTIREKRLAKISFITARQAKEVISIVANAAGRRKEYFIYKPRQKGALSLP